MAEPFDVDTLSEEVLVIPRFLETVLERVVSVYQSYGVDLPARRLWTVNPGQVPHDCEQVVVALQNLSLGLPGDQSVMSAQNCRTEPTSGMVSITIVRPAHVSKTVLSPEKVQAYALAPAVDAWILQQSLPQIDQWNDQWGGPAGGVISTTRFLQPQGGLQGVEMLISMVIS
jgi:hypothetical protein